VYIVIRGDSFYKGMSYYLARRIEETPNIEVLYNTCVRRMYGAGRLGAVEIVNMKTGQVRTLQTPALFSFIGAVPYTDWLPPEIERDEKKFVRTGGTVARSAHWTAGREPFCWRPAARACSPPETCGPARSSASLPRSGKARWRFSSCMST
jgi:thioredoxin reductase (NADPH)